MKIASDVHCVKCCAQSIIGCNQEVSPGGGEGGFCRMIAPDVYCVRACQTGACMLTCRLGLARFIMVLELHMSPGRVLGLHWICSIE